MSTISLTSTPRIAIIGAGVAGLTAARVLQTKGHIADVLERDESANARAQGGSLDLKEQGGQLALKSAKLHDEFKKHMREEGQDTKWTLKDGTVVGIREDTGDEYNPEINRGTLKGIFLDVLGDQVKWGAHVKSIERKKGGGFDISLANGATSSYDIVIGADGSNSKIRPLLSDDIPAYTGALFIETYISDVSTTHPTENATVGRGSLYVLSDGKGVFGQQNGGDTLRIYLVIQEPEGWAQTNDLTWDQPQVIREQLIERYISEWHDDYKALIRASSDTPRIWPIYALPIGHRWEHQPGLTVIGDAAHVMSPFAGEGANIAMIDGAKLGELIAEGVKEGKLDEKIAKFESDMFERATISARASHDNMKICLGGESALRDLFDGISAHIDEYKASGSQSKGP